MGGCPSNTSNNAVIKPKTNIVIKKALSMSQRKNDLLPEPVGYFIKSKLKDRKPFLLILQYLPIKGKRSKKLMSFLICMNKKG
jgi:hypothetical protein